MMRLPEFTLRTPRTIDEGATWLAEAPHDAMLLAGGTDLLPNMKRRQQTPRTVIAIGGIPTLRAIGRRDDRSITIGAATTLTAIARDASLHAAVPGLWQAIVQIATPHLRNMGTIGGNLCLDTRCTYYDQSLEWRKAIDFCLKKDGSTCWVATSSPRCLAVSSTDSAPMLQALDARVRLVSANGTREIAVADLYRLDGMHYLTRRADEILTEIVVPNPEGWRSAYWKLRRRGSFDFPVASVAVSAKLQGDHVEAIRLVLGAVASRPLDATKAIARLTNRSLDDDAIADAADAAYEIAKPMDNTDFELIWRKKAVRALITHALQEIRGDDVRGARLRIARQLL